MSDANFKDSVIYTYCHIFAFTTKKLTFKCNVLHFARLRVYTNVHEHLTQNMLGKSESRE